MKKIFALGLFIILLFSVGGCKPVEEPKDPNDVFNGLPSLDGLILEDEEKIIEVRNQYETLSSEDKSKITIHNLEKLTELEAKIEELKLEQAKEIEAKDFQIAVAKIPSLNDISLDDEAYIASIRSYYNGLASDIKVLVEEALLTLEKAEEQLLILHEQNKQAKAQKIIDDILGLPTLESITIADYDVVENIIDEYDALPNDIQLLVDQSYLQILMRYHNRLVGLLEIANFVAKLHELPPISQLTLADETRVVSLRNQFNELATWQKNAVEFDDLLLLEDYELEIQELIKEDLNQRTPQAMEDLKVYLEDYIPDEIIENVDFFTSYIINGVDLTLFWSTGDSSINYLGQVVKPAKDRNVTITVRITRGKYLETYSKNVIVKGVGEIVMPDFEPGKKITFAYMRNKDGNQDVLYNRDYNMLDVINYSFAKISGGKLSVSGLTNLNNVLTLRQKGIRVVIVVDGVSNDTANAFNIMSASPISRKVFINSVMEVIDLYQLDGLDLDWEINVNTTNFNLLCKELREAFDKYNRKLILSAAVGVATNAFDARTLANYLDYLHIMTYGMGSTSRVTHETALYSGSGVTYSVDYAVNKYSSQGFPKSKMTFGIQFYVRMGTVSGNPVNPFGLPMTSARSIGYASFLSNYFNANQQYQYFDPNTSSYYWYDGTTYASYDNQQSVKLKCQYAENQGLAGVMYWDYGHDLTGTLLSAIYQEFNN